MQNLNPQTRECAHSGNSNLELPSNSILPELLGREGERRQGEGEGSRERGKERRKEEREQWLNPRVFMNFQTGCQETSRNQGFQLLPALPGVRGTPANGDTTLHTVEPGLTQESGIPVAPGVNASPLGRRCPGSRGSHAGQ